jgi:hypothetical protein
MEYGRTIYTICSGLGLPLVPSVALFRQKLFFAWSLDPRNLTPNPLTPSHSGKGTKFQGAGRLTHNLQVAQKVCGASGGIVHPLAPLSKLNQYLGCAFGCQSRLGSVMVGVAAVICLVEVLWR